MLQFWESRQLLLRSHHIMLSILSPCLVLFNEKSSINLTEQRSTCLDLELFY
ncbi:hypothetical protein MtrunA17_Chr6g0478381 [Medicago truncatula]|uniref:Uncharacterized protein n=1 Tax=Medicago truncatula TaxID=3880 RepID=A0A396HK52_MEDTR|nr:hypothetical protein MtrunA17_Chr6g0478381 [Medicago truncatula]